MNIVDAPKGYGYTVVGAPRWASEIARRSPLNAKRDRYGFLALRSYFDGSRTKSPPGKVNVLTLAGHLATDDTWAEFETEWRSILDSNTPRPEYMHMKEAMFLRGQFSTDLGWDRLNVRSLLKRLLGLVYEERWHGPIQAISCTIRLDDYKRAIDQGYLFPKPHQICAHACLSSVLRWENARIDTIPIDQLARVDKIEVFFDRGEPFMRHLERLWNKSKKSDRLGWDMVANIAPAEMRQVPALQLADMLAWATNRRASFGDHTGACNAILHSLDTREYNFDYEQLVKSHALVMP